MHTIKEASELLEISQVAVYSWIKKKQVKKLVFKQNGKTLINPEAIDVIKDLRKEVKTLKNQVKNDDKKSGSSYNKTEDFNSFNKVVFNLTEQLKTKDEQIKAKDDQINKLLKLNENAQVLMKEQQNKVIMLEEENQNSWWQKIFKTK